MCAHALSHQSWAGLHAISYFSYIAYWGHAARIESWFPPISVVPRIRNTPASWKQNRRRLGSSPYWEVGAQNKDNWRIFINRCRTIKHLQPLSYYPDLTRVDLLGRSLLQVGEKFTLLPFRHVPVEQPYDSSYTLVPSVEDHADETTIQVCSDGSHRTLRLTPL